MRPLLPGARIALPRGAFGFSAPRNHDLAAAVVGDDGRLRSDTDVADGRPPPVPGVLVADARVVVAPHLLRPGTAGVLLLAAGGPAPSVSVTDGGGRLLARIGTAGVQVGDVQVLAVADRGPDGWRLRTPGAHPADPVVVLSRRFALELGAVGVSPVSALENAVLAATNAARTQHGLVPLTADRRLQDAARRHGTDMATRAFFAHTCPDGTDVGDRADVAGYRWGRVAENLAAGQGSAADAVRCWMGSPTHRANILGPFTEIGIGHAEGGPYGVYWTQVFATRR